MTTTMTTTLLALLFHLSQSFSSDCTETTRFLQQAINNAAVVGGLIAHQTCLP